MQLDKRHVRRHFQHAAATYDQAAVVQHYMADELTARLQVVKLAPQRVLDVGCGTGYAYRELTEQYPDAELILLDFASNMFRQGPPLRADQDNPICGDAEVIPIAPHSIDLIYCNAVLHWCRLDLALLEFLRILKPHGLLTFSTFGPDTLTELRTAWGKIDTYVHVHEFPDMHNIGDALVQHQFTTPVMDVDYVKVTHKDLKSVLRDLKQSGTTNAAMCRHRGLMGKGKLSGLEEAMDGFRNDQGLIESTYEIVYGHAWAPAQITLDDATGDIEIPLTQLYRS